MDDANASKAYSSSRMEHRYTISRIRPKITSKLVAIHLQHLNVVTQTFIYSTASVLLDTIASKDRTHSKEKSDSAARLFDSL
jgi:hypothetical protein